MRKTLLSAVLAAALVVGFFVVVDLVVFEAQHGSGIGGPHPRSVINTARHLAPIGFWGGAWGLSARDYHISPRYPEQVAPSNLQDENIQREHRRGALVLIWDDGNDSAADILVDLLDGTSAERTPVNKADGLGTAAVLVDVDNPGVAGYLTNGIAGTSLFRLGQTIKIGTNAETRIIRILDDNTIQIEDAQTWADDDHIDLTFKGGFGIMADSLGQTHTGRATATCSGACDATRKDDGGRTATNADAGTAVTISGAAFFSATEQINYVGGMIRFCTDGGCTDDEAARYTISAIGGANALTTSTAISGAHSTEGFYVSSAATDDCLTNAEIQTLAGSGHDILFHGANGCGVSTPTYGNLSETEAVTEIETWLPVLEGVTGTRVESMVYPSNYTSPGMMQVVGRYFRSAFGGGNISHSQNANVPPITTYYLLRNQGLDSGSVTLASAQTDIDNIDAANGMGVLFAHGITSGMEEIYGDILDDTILNHPDLLILSPSEALDLYGNRFDAYGVSIGANGTIGRTDIVEGFATAGSGTTITLSDQASPIDGAYDGALVWITQGTGASQLVETASGYDGATKILTVSSFDPAPDATSKYRILQRKIVLEGELSYLDIRGDREPLLHITDSGLAAGVKIFDIDLDDGSDFYLKKATGANNDHELRTTGATGDHGLEIVVDEDGSNNRHITLRLDSGTCDNIRDQIVAIGTSSAAADILHYFTCESGVYSKPPVSFPGCSSIRVNQHMRDPSAGGCIKECIGTCDIASSNVGDACVADGTCTGGVCTFGWTGCDGIFTQDVHNTVCNLGEFRHDTGGGTNELCFCDPANTWNCVATGALAD
jgi:hypothetical protein